MFVSYMFRIESKVPLGTRRVLQRECSDWQLQARAVHTALLAPGSSGPADGTDRCDGCGTFMARKAATCRWPVAVNGQVFWQLKYYRVASVGLR